MVRGVVLSVAILIASNLLLSCDSSFCAGTRHTASDDVLSARIEPGHTHLPSAADDLCSLVRCYHLTNRRHLVPTLLVLSKPTEILDFWLGIDKEPTIAAFMRLAKDLDYANLSRLMNHSMRVA